jgi:hypothetical protein
VRRPRAGGPDLTRLASWMRPGGRDLIRPASCPRRRGPDLIRPASSLPAGTRERIRLARSTRQRARDSTRLTPRTRAGGLRTVDWPRISPAGIDFGSRMRSRTRSTRVRPRSRGLVPGRPASASPRDELLPARARPGRQSNRVQPPRARPGRGSNRVQPARARPAPRSTGFYACRPACRPPRAVRGPSLVSMDSMNAVGLFDQALPDPLPLKALSTARSDR